MTLPRLHPRQNAIAAVLGVTPPFTNPAMLAAEALRRQVFIEDTLQASGLTTLALGISGGVDSLVAGRLAQLAVQALRTRTRNGRYRFIAVRLPYGTQHDEDAARAALAFIRADEECTVPIEAAAQAGRAPAQAVHPARPPARCCAGQRQGPHPHGGAIRPGQRHGRAGDWHRPRRRGGDGLLRRNSAMVRATWHRCPAWSRARCAPSPPTWAHRPNWFSKTPTADLEDLAPGRPDEAAYGVTYDQIDAFLHGQPVDAQAFQRIVTAYEASGHKRAQPLTP